MINSKGTMTSKMKTTSKIAYIPLLLISKLGGWSNHFFKISQFQFGNLYRTIQESASFLIISDRCKPNLTNKNDIYRYIST